jgi:hypothetical protein
MKFQQGAEFPDLRSEMEISFIPKVGFGWIVFQKGVSSAQRTPGGFYSYAEVIMMCYGQE